jgi:hypothetical protein
MSVKGVHYRPIALPKCLKCEESATDELWDGDRFLGQFCPAHGNAEFHRLRGARP